MVIGKSNKAGPNAAISAYCDKACISLDNAVVTSQIKADVNWAWCLLDCLVNSICPSNFFQHISKS